MRAGNRVEGNHMWAVNMLLLLRVEMMQISAYEEDEQAFLQHMDCIDPTVVVDKLIDCVCLR